MKNVGKHENIISLLGCCTKSGPLYAIVEYAKFGNLRNYLRTQRPKDYMLYTGLVEDSNSDYEEEKYNNENDNGSHNLSNILKLYSNVNINKTSSKVMSTFGTLKHDAKSEQMITKDELNDLLESDSLAQLNLTIDLLRFCVQISNGLRYLHTKKVCHRDLAARNILLDENKVAKIADFGFARDLQQNYYYKRKSEAPIPVKWMAPETLFDRKVYQNSDIWSFGVLMWEVFTLGGNPYPSVQVEKLFEYLKEGNRMSKPMYADDEM
jgi:FMS-like tyrosine kinase 1